MAALAISAHLPFVQRDKGDFPVGGHGFRRAHEVARAFRQDFFFAGDERNLIAALYRDDPLIHLPREEARSEEHTSELPSLMRIPYAVFGLKKKKQKTMK